MSRNHQDGDGTHGHYHQFPPPSLVSNQAVAFTYNSDASFPLYNRGGVVENCRLFTNGVDATNVLPMGLTVTASNGLCVIEGMSSHLTLTANYTIASVPVVVEASNGDGVSRALVGVSVEPRYVSGDMSLGVVPVSILSIDTNTNTNTNMEPASVNTNTIVQTGIGLATLVPITNDSLVYQADAIPFASGGTGAYNDPVIIGIIDDKVNRVSFVIDFDDVTVPVEDFSGRTNVEEQSFHINLLFKSPEGITFTGSYQLMKDDLDNGEAIDLVGISKNGVTSRGIINNGYALGSSLVPRLISPFSNSLFVNLQIHLLKNGIPTSNLKGVFRFSILNN